MTVKTDIYVLGTALYQMLCGAAPFTTTGPNVALAKQLYVPMTWIAVSYKGSDRMPAPPFQQRSDPVPAEGAQTQASIPSVAAKQGRQIHRTRLESSIGSSRSIRLTAAEHPRARSPLGDVHVRT